MINIIQFKYYISIALLILTSTSHQAVADPVNVNITGRVIVGPCTVDTSSVNQTVDFGQQHSTHLRTPGSALSWQPFQVKLTNCPAGTTVATMTFNGLPFMDDATLYSNSGTATNVAVQIAQDADKTQIQGNGSGMAVTVDAQHNAIYALAARLITPAGNVGPGTVRSVVQINFTYQ